MAATRPSANVRSGLIHDQVLLSDATNTNATLEEAEFAKHEIFDAGQAAPRSLGQAISQPLTETDPNLPLAIEAPKKSAIQKSDKSNGIVIEQDRRDRSSTISAEQEAHTATAKSSSTRSTIVGSKKALKQIEPAIPQQATEDIARASENTMDYVQQRSDAADRLRQLQSVELQEISRNRQAQKHRKKDKYATTSLHDLDLARRKVNHERPLASFRTWAEDSPVMNPRLGYEYNDIEASHNVVDSNLSLGTTPQIPQLPSTTKTSMPDFAPSRSKWAAKEDMKADKLDSASNAWGSAAPSDATKGSNVSDRSFGKLLQRKQDGFDTGLQDWEGNWNMPPADWHERPRYNNNNAMFKQAFKAWIESLSAKQEKILFSNGVEYNIIPAKVLEDLNNVADGMHMCRPNTTISVNNASQYGYTNEDALDAIRKYANKTQSTDFEKWDVLDMTDDNNDKFSNETTEDLITNWLQHLNFSRAASDEVGYQHMMKIQTTEHMFEAEPEEELEEPKLNIYLRPATKADVSEITRIYNWYVENGMGPVETQMISESEIRDRIDYCKQSQLPFLVAAKRNQKHAQAVPVIDDHELSRQLNLPVTHRKRQTLTRIEMLAGFCSAQDLTAKDYVEHTSAELELYVDPQYKHMGVGKCLLDKILHILDRGHRMTTKCSFHCDQSIRHLYDAGGDRNVHKLYFVLRKYHTPKAGTISLERKRHRKSPYTKTKFPEDEYGQWMKAWLEKFDFEEEGLLKKAGAKFGR